jgi:hypothetical protein
MKIDHHEQNKNYPYEQTKNKTILSLVLFFVILKLRVLGGQILNLKFKIDRKKNLYKGIL